MELQNTEQITLIRHRQPADRAPAEPKTLPSVVAVGPRVDVGNAEPVELPPVTEGCVAAVRVAGVSVAEVAVVAGSFLTWKLRD